MDRWTDRVRVMRKKERERERDTVQNTVQITVILTEQEILMR